MISMMMIKTCHLLEEVMVMVITMMEIKENPKNPCRMNLPLDILLDIIIRIPLKSIVRFRCLNHSWYSKLKCPNFLEERNQYAVEMGKFNLMFHNYDDIYTFNYDTTLSTYEKTSHMVYTSRVACPLNGKIVLGLVLSYGCLNIVLYDPKHVTFETIAVHSRSVKASAGSSSVYMENLFSLGTGTYLGKDDFNYSSEENDDDDSTDGEEE
ncbi:hypothetical protein C5167_021654 [Papaver somniferum]|nr:hypothetical protein C5167_021654 [Papaver somniferum]